MHFDRLDLRILDCLQNDSSLTNHELANRVGISPSASLKRVRRLRENGVIEREVVLLAPEKLFPTLHMVVEVIMERDHKPLYQEFIRIAVAAPEVKQCYQVTGEVDFVLIVMVADMNAYDQFCDRVLYSHPNMKKFRTLISRKRNKFDTSVTLPAV
ncbi:Lrp/AsnC family transcriptional regulator [Nitrincola sp. MINF-07-Sa-05]|uniref:Lrp/AsnC family transcriptional regulator n=1 Tax=Nitrincola salilacus TaxID=3400273 RepID=UPI0039186488